MTSMVERHTQVGVQLIRSSIALVIALSLSLFEGCSRSISTDSSFQYSTIQGTVTNDPGAYSAGESTGAFSLAKSSSAVQGATVVAMRVMTGGSLTEISDTVQTDANGNFSLLCDATSINNVIVVATKASSKWKAVVGSTLNQGATEYCQPLNDQTTVQADVYIRMVADVGADAVTYADVVDYVSSSVAAAVQQDTTAEAQTAMALEAGESAWAEAMSSTSVGNASQYQTNTLLLVRTTAEESLESSLNASGENQAAAETDFQNYQQADFNAYVIEGISAETVAKVEEIFARAITNTSVSGSAGVKFAIYQQAAQWRAFVIKSGIHAMMQIIGATHTEIDSADIAGATLQSWIKSSTTNGQIDTAFKGYHDAVLRLTAEGVGANASIMANVDAQINAGGGAKAILFGAISNQVSAQALVQAYATFFSAVSAAANSSMMSMSKTQVDAVAQILMLANMTA